MKELLFKISKLKEWILDIIFPRECFGCGQEGSYLCANCFSQLKFNQKFDCVFCHRQTEMGKVCSHCRQNDIDLDAVWVAVNYNDLKIQKLIAGLKYNYIKEISEILAKILNYYQTAEKIFSNFEINKDNSLIVPVPLGAKRLLSRGYNQSELIGREFEKICGLPQQNLLRRKINTISQVNLKREERQANVKDAFTLNQPLIIPLDKKIILIDDVLTTGSTLNECAKVLKAAGFKDVYGLVISQRED